MLILTFVVARLQDQACPFFFQDASIRVLVFLISALGDSVFRDGAFTFAQYSYNHDHDPQCFFTEDFNARRTNNMSTWWRSEKSSDASIPNTLFNSCENLLTTGQVERNFCHEENKFTVGKWSVSPCFGYPRS